jgi:murein DD-endopeptidase MepM/ murein hydrolase activator NlpD
MQVSKEDSLLRVLVEEEERFNLPSGPGSELKLGNSNLFTPLKGLVTNGFNLNEAHYGVDIVAKENEVIKAAQNGTVIFAEWTAETGNVIIIQHDNKFISAYKHNSALLKQQGEEVKSGEPIAIIGNSGVLSSGPHLHFELWYDGFPVNPESYILF